MRQICNGRWFHETCPLLKQDHHGPPFCQQCCSYLGEHQSHQDWPVFTQMISLRQCKPNGNMGEQQSQFRLAKARCGTTNWRWVLNTKGVLSENTKQKHTKIIVFSVSWKPASLLSCLPYNSHISMNFPWVSGSQTSAEPGLQKRTQNSKTVMLTGQWLHLMIYKEIWWLMVIYRLKNYQGLGAQCKAKFSMFPRNKTVGFSNKRTSPEFVRCNSGKQKHLNQDNLSNLPQVPSEPIVGKTIILTTASTIAAKAASSLPPGSGVSIWEEARSHCQNSPALP